MKKFIVLSIVLLMLAGFAITSSAQLVTVTLFTDQTLPVGTLTVAVVGGDLIVTYDITDSGWELLETHLYVGKLAPKKSAPGRFPYGPEHVYILSPGVYTIPLADFDGATTLYIAAHAEIGMIDEFGDPVLDVPEIGEQIEETAWATGEEGFEPIPPGKNWAMYFEFVLVVPE